MTNSVISPYNNYPHADQNAACPLYHETPKLQAGRSMKGKYNVLSKEGRKEEKEKEEGNEGWDKSTTSPA